MSEMPKNVMKREPLKRTRVNLKTGVVEEHYFTPEEIKIIKSGGRVVVGNEATWQKVNDTR